MSILLHSRAHRAGRGTLRHRIVLRKLDDEYVVHTQIFRPDGSWHFEQGDYFRTLRDAASRYWERAGKFITRYAAFLEDTR